MHTGGRPADGPCITGGRDSPALASCGRTINLVEALNKMAPHHANEIERLSELCGLCHIVQRLRK